MNEFNDKSEMLSSNIVSPISKTITTPTGKKRVSSPRSEFTERSHPQSVKKTKVDDKGKTI